MKEVEVISSVLLPLEEYNKLQTQIENRHKHSTRMKVNKTEAKVSNIQPNDNIYKPSHKAKKSIKTRKKPNPLIVPQINPKIAILTKLRQQRNKQIQNIIKKTPPFDKKQVIMDNITVNKSKIEKIVDWLLANQDIISWNRDRELILYGTPIPDTDITTIFRHLFTFKEDPNTIAGAVAFYESIKEVGLPSDMINNTKP